MASTIERNTQAQASNQNISDPEWVHNARMEEYRRVLYSGAAVPESDVIEKPAPKKALTFADSVPAEAPSAAERLAQYHPIYAPSSPRNLFEDVALKNGELVSVVSNTQASAAVSPVGAAVAPAPVVIPEADDADARPTPRTMASLSAQSESQSFFASLSTRTKVVLAAIAAAIVLVIALICINTALINSVNAQIAEKETIVKELEEQSEMIRKTVRELQDDETINEWAESIGMTHS